MYFWTRYPKKALEIPYHAYFLSFHFWAKFFCPKQKISKIKKQTFLVKTNDLIVFLALKYIRNDEKYVK